MRTSSKLIRIVVLASSLMLLTIYVVCSQYPGRMAAAKSQEKFMLPGSKSLTGPVFSTETLESEATEKGADADAVPAQKP